MNNSKKALVKKSFNENGLKILTFIFLIFLFSNPLKAQNIRLQSEAMNSQLNYPGGGLVLNSIVRADTIKKDDTTDASNLGDLSSLSLAFNPKLLPDNMSFMEKFLWDENGLVRKIGIAGPLTAENRDSELRVRRTMLTIHQVAGLTTLALMIATDYYGQRTLDGRTDLSGTHKTLVGFTIGSYALTGLMTILSPPPLIRRDDNGGTTGIHKILAWIHFAGMILTPILGSLIVNHRVLNIDKAHFHQVSAYLTTAVFAASVVVLTF